MHADIADAAVDGHGVGQRLHFGRRGIADDVEAGWGTSRRTSGSTCVAKWTTASALGG